MKEYINTPGRLVEELKQLLTDGEVNPILVKIMHDDFSKLMKDNFVKGLIMDEADKHDKNFDVSGIKFVKSSRVAWSYKHANVWKDANDEQKRLEELMKKSYLRNVNSEDNEEYTADNVGDVYDPVTGELVPPAQRTSSEFIKRTI